MNCKKLISAIRGNLLLKCGSTELSCLSRGLPSVACDGCAGVFTCEGICSMLVLEVRMHLANSNTFYPWVLG